MNSFPPFLSKAITVIAFITMLNISAKAQISDTTHIHYSADLKQVIKPKHAYHQTLTMKLFLSQALFDGKFKRKDNGRSEVALTFSQALDVIKKMDNLTLGIPKIVYLVGWQYNGHDSKYPAWFDVNERLKRPEDKTALESLKWLMKEASKYHTVVSLHINMFDAYEDSPLWDTYVKNNIIARNADGSLRACEWGYPISYAREWETGFAQKRIDSLCKLLPLQSAQTIHIDAFHTWPPVPTMVDGKYKLSFDKAPTSPFLGNTVQNESEAQRKIYQYWASKGVDVTCEGVNFLRETSFEGYQPMAWWFTGLENYLKWPASFYCGGQDNSEWGKLFGTSMHGEDVARKDPQQLSGFIAQFCTKTLLWYYLNRLDREYVVSNSAGKSVHFSQNTVSALKGKEFSVQSDDVLLAENEDVFIPALWLKKPTVIAFSKNGYQNRRWKLPKSLRKNRQLSVWSITADGLKSARKVQVAAGAVTLSLGAGEALLID
jgi:hypothetical protein